MSALMTGGEYKLVCSYWLTEYIIAIGLGLAELSKEC